MARWVLTVTIKDERDRDIHKEILDFAKREHAEEQLRLALTRGNIQSQARVGNKDVTITNERGEQIGFNLYGYRSHN